MHDNLWDLKSRAQGIVFLDMFPILRDPRAFETLITHFVHHLTSKTLLSLPEKKIDVVVGLDARGFLLGPIIALRLGAAFVPVRKAGKLPGKCATASYEKEYGVVSAIRVVWVLVVTLVDPGFLRDAGRCHRARPDGRRCRRSDRDR